MKISITDALLVILIDSGISVDGTNILDSLHRAEDNVLEANKDSLLTGNLDEFGGLSENGRRNVLHTKRESEFVDRVIDEGMMYAGGVGGLFS